MSEMASSWPPPGSGSRSTGERHHPGGLPEDGTYVDVDGHADYNTMGNGRTLDAVAVAEKPRICSSCGAIIDPLTMGCRC